jgi:amidase
MQTTAGCIALEGSIVLEDAAVIANLRKKGAIILGKANLMELSSGAMIGGPHERLAWSGRGGRCYSAYVEGGDPSGSSSGSTVGTSAGFAAAALGGDTTGSITFPASSAACYSFRPTLGLIPTAGTIPLAKYMDTLGPITKSAYDAALLLTHMVGFTQDLGADGKQ